MTFVEVLEQLRSRVQFGEKLKIAVYGMIGSAQCHMINVNSQDLVVELG